MLKEKYISRIKETSINVSQTKIDSIRNKDIEKTGIRVYENGGIGYAGAIGKYDEGELKNRAKDSLKNNISYPYELEETHKKHEDFSTEIISENELVSEIEELLTLIRNEQSDFYFSNKIYLTESEVKIQNDKGLDLYYRDRLFSLELLFKEKSSVNIMDGFVAFQGRKYDRKLALDMINEVCNAYKNKVQLPKKEILPVVFQTDETLPMKKLLQDLDGNNFGSGSSLLNDKKDKKVFSENFTLYQNNNPIDTFAPFFDAEGVVNKNYRYNLIQGGVVLSPYTDKRTAKKYNLPLTGAAVGEYDSIPTLGEPILTIEESEKTAKELLNGEMGIFVLIASGGDFTPEGNFGTPVQLAFLFDGEKLIGRLPELNVSSNVFDMFGESFRGVSQNTISPLSNSKYLIMDMKVSEI